jgi:hypothetical protein
LIVYVPPGGTGIAAWDFGVSLILYWVCEVFAVRVLVLRVIDVVALLGLDAEP